MHFIKCLIIVVMALNIGARALYALPEPIVISEQMEVYNYTEHLDQFVDGPSKLTFAQSASLENEKNFERVIGKSVHLRDGARWFRLIIENPTDRVISVYLQTDIVSHVQLAELSKENSVASAIVETGGKVSFSQRPLPFLHPTIDLAVEPGKHMYLLRSEGRSFSLSLGSKLQVTRQAQIFETLVSFCLATFIALGLYNFFIYTRVRDVAYLLYALRCAVISGLCTVATNFAQKYLFPDLQFDFQSIPPWLSAVNLIVWIFIATKFLSLDRFIPRRVLKIGTYGLVTGLAIGSLQQILFPSAEPCLLLRIFNPLALIANISVGIYVCSKRYRPAYFYVPANIIYFSGVLIMILGVEGVIASTTYLYLAPVCAGAIESILMSFGLGDKYLWYMKAAQARLNHKNDELGRELQGMLSSLKQGIFSIDSNGKIGEEYSDYLETLLETTDIKGKNVFNLIFDRSNLSPERRLEIKHAVSAAFGEGGLSFKLHEHKLPLEMVIQTENFRRILELDWQPLFMGEKHFDKLMVVLRDVTDVRKMQEQSERSQTELQIVGQVLAISTRTYEKFSQSADNLIAENFRLIEEGKNAKVMDVASMYRNIHTIKGHANSFGLTFIASISTEVEEYFSDILSSHVGVVSREKLILDLLGLRRIVAKYDQVLADLLAASLKDSPIDLVHRLRQLHDEYSDLEEVKEKFFEVAVGQMVKRYYNSFEAMLTPVVKSQKQIAEKLQLPIPEFAFRGDPLTLMVEIEDSIRSIFSQIFRNSLEHGSEQDRRDGTEMESRLVPLTVIVETILSNDDLTFEVYDSGSGLHLARLAERYGNPFMSDQDIAETIFQIGVTTSARVSQISGRGVGMDIVKHLVLKLGGTIEIIFTKPKSAEGRRVFKFRMTFPLSLVQKLR